MVTFQMSQVDSGYTGIASSSRMRVACVLDCEWVRLKLCSFTEALGVTVKRDSLVVVSNFHVQQRPASLPLPDDKGNLAVQLLSASLSFTE